MLLPQVRWPLFLTPACSLVLLESAFHITNRVISLKHRSFDTEAFQRLPVATACQQGLSSSVAFCILPPNIELRNALKDINFNCYMILPSFEVIRCYLTGSMCTSLYMSCCLMPKCFLYTPFLCLRGSFSLRIIPSTPFHPEKPHSPAHSLWNLL